MLILVEETFLYLMNNRILCFVIKHKINISNVWIKITLLEVIYIEKPKQIHYYVQNNIINGKQIVMKESESFRF